MDNNKNNYPKVSIIMTVYNGDLNLESSIQSILNQSYSNIELIIIDDCSTDNSKKILKKYNNKQNIKIIYNKKNIGCYASKNIGLKVSTGEIIGFQDADDISLKDRIKKQVNLMLKYNLLLCGCNIIRSNIKKLVSEREMMFFINNTNYRKIFGYVTLLIYKSVFNKYGNFIERRKGMDMEFGERILYHELNIKFKNECSWTYFNTTNNKIYMKLNKMLYICSKMNKNNLSYVKDDYFLKYKIWRKLY